MLEFYAAKSVDFTLPSLEFLSTTLKMLFFFFHLFPFCFLNLKKAIWLIRSDFCLFVVFLKYPNANVLHWSQFSFF